MKKKKSIRDLLRFKSIRSSILVSFGFLIVLSLFIFMMISLNYTEDTVLENSKNYTMQLVEQLNADIDSYIEYMDTISQMAANNSDVSEYLFGKKAKSQSSYIRLTDQFKTVMDTRSDILNIAVIASNGRRVLNDGSDQWNDYMDPVKMEWYRNTLDAKGSPVVSSSHVQNAVKDTYRWVVTLSRGLVNPHTDKIEGMFFIDLNYSAINSLCEKISLGNKGYLFIVDKEGSIIYHPQQQLLYSGLKSEYIEQVLDLKNGSFIASEGANSKLYSICSSGNTGWTVVGVSYIKEMMKKKQETQIVYVAIASLLFVLSIGMSVLLSMEITKPIQALKDSMKEVEKGHFDNASFIIKEENEIASLGNSFNIMTREIKHLMEQNVREQSAKRKNELRALQSQINPHFLYNTLDSIIWMAESGKNQEVVLMTSSLARLLRQSISNEDEIVTIEREIGYTQSYLTIQKMRYRDQLEFVIDVDEEILQKKIVKLVIQPLVENAIYHGIKYLEDKGMIWITGSSVDGKIILCIRDNGVGMEEETLSHILENKHPVGKSNKVGVHNVHNRLQLYYGTEYGLTYESTFGIGTTVSIVIPDEEVDENEK